MSKLPCGHPEACRYDGDGSCAWCEEVERMQSMIDALEENIERKAVVISGGPGSYVTITLTEPIGYLKVINSKVTIEKWTHDGAESGDIVYVNPKRKNGTQSS